MSKTQRFSIWLKGFLDACGNKPTDEQVATIKDVLNSLFEHVIEPPSKEKEEVINTPNIWKPPHIGGGTTYRC